MPQTILAIGAHYDDCVFGIPGILLKAIRQHHRVVILSLIGDYSNWRPVRGRERELLEGTVEICREYGADMRYLDFAEMKFDVDVEAKRKVAAAVAEIAPDRAFFLYSHDRHSDHVVASALSGIALRHADRLVEDVRYRPPRRMYMYDNGPRHTIGFEPNTFVDVSDEWPAAIEWLGRFMALLRNEPFEPNKQHPAQRAKESLAAYRGQTCGVRYAEAVRSVNEYPQDPF